MKNVNQKTLYFQLIIISFVDTGFVNKGVLPVSFSGYHKFS
jgi:hypothetical protein